MTKSNVADICTSCGHELDAHGVEWPNLGCCWIGCHCSAMDGIRPLARIIDPPASTADRLNPMAPRRSHREGCMIPLGGALCSCGADPLAGEEG